MKKNNVVVCGRADFPEQVRNKPGWAYISISATPECAEYWLFDKSEVDHYLPSGPNVLNLNFDDLTDDMVYHGHLFKTISEDQAREIVEFVENNLDKNILIHCRAGKSRSQGVFRFILDMYSDNYEECPENKLNPCITPNVEVIRKCKRAYYENNPFIFSKAVIKGVNYIGKYVVDSDETKPRVGAIRFLIGLIDGVDENYYALVDSKGRIEYISLVLGIKEVSNSSISFIESCDLDEIVKTLKKDMIGFSESGEFDGKPIKLWEKIEEKWD